MSEARMILFFFLKIPLWFLIGWVVGCDCLSFKMLFIFSTFRGRPLALFPMAIAERNQGAILSDSLQNRFGATTAVRAMRVVGRAQRMDVSYFGRWS